MDLGLVVAFVSVLVGAAVVGMSYFGAYMLGRARARAELEMERRLPPAESTTNAATAQRLLVIERAVASMARALERLTEAERQSILDRIQSHEVQRISAAAKYDTPA
jgi:hypothetical protein